ncbi:hypothetical protein SMATCC274_14160 [Serratia marcescens]|nr:hypothetical protein SMATCC274_14160 [Serratia marcescens]
MRARDQKHLRHFQIHTLYGGVIAQLGAGDLLWQCVALRGTGGGQIAGQLYAVILVVHRRQARRYRRVFGFFLELDFAVIDTLPVEIDIKRIFTRQNIIPAGQRRHLGDIVIAMDEGGVELLLRHGHL